MADECTLKRWAFDHTVNAMKAMNGDSLYTAARELKDAAMWLDQALEAQAKREADEKAAKILAAYTDLADAA